MTSATQTILDDILDCCSKSNISESIGKDKNGYQVNLIHYAAGKGHTQVVEKLLNGGIEVNLPAPNKEKKSPLNYALENGHLEFAEFLLEKDSTSPCYIYWSFRHG